MTADTTLDTGAYARRSMWARGGALVSIALMLAIIAIETLLAPTNGRNPNVVVWLALSLPLLVFLPGLWRGGVRSYAWLSFVSLLYFAQAVTTVFVVAPQALDFVSLFATVTLFVCTLLFVRWRARAERSAAQN